MKINHLNKSKWDLEMIKMFNQFGLKIKLIRIIFILIVSTSCMLAGLVKGRITGFKSGKPLVGANVILKNVDKDKVHGVASDKNGRYLISSVPAGRYIMTVSYIGYAKHKIKGLEVSENRMRKINVELKPKSLQSDSLVVTAKKPAVDVKTSSSSEVINSQEIQRMPGATSAKDIMAMQSGVVQVNGKIHVRGGRSDEVLYLIDGVPASNPVTGVNAVDIDKNQIQEVEVIKGGFSARYGNAQSAIINIITKSGKDYIDVDFHAKTDLLSPGRNEGYKYGYLGVNGPIKFLPGKGNFSTSLTADLKNGYYHMGGDYGESQIGPLSIPNHQHTNYKGTANLDYRPINTIRLNLKYRYQNNFNKNYNYAWKNLPNSVPINRQKVDKYTAIFKHSLSENTYYRVHASYQSIDSYDGLLGLDSPKDTWGYRVSLPYEDRSYNISLSERDEFLEYMPDDFDHTNFDYSRTNPQYLPPVENIDINKDHFIDFGLHKNYEESQSQVFDIKSRFVKHIAKIHKIEAGLSYKSKNIDFLNIQGYQNYYPERDSLPGKYPRYGNLRWYFNDTPQRGSFYLQDRIDYAGMYILLGVRGDYYLHGNTINSDEYIEAFNTNTGSDVNEFDRIQSTYSPRFGLSIPANTSTKVFFNYGYFSQQPSFEQMYRDPFLNSVIGNPNLEPRKSINYELGVESEFVKNWVLRVKIFGKDYSDAIGGRQTDTEPINVVYQNTGFGSSRGFETELRKEYANFYGITANYTYLLARGFSLASLDAYQQGSTVPPPVRAQRMGYDINHSFKLQFSFHVPEKRPLKIFGKYFKDVGFNMTFRANSGVPYTPVIPNKIYIEQNSATGPNQFYMDANFRKGFRVGDFRFRLFVEAKNLLNFRNPNISNSFNKRTGEVYDYGNLAGTSNKYMKYPDLLFRRGIYTYNRERLIRLGIKINFN